MADTKITALAAITTVDPAADVLPIVDISDTSMAASGTTKKITSNQILGAGGTATLASATITGAATVGTTLGVTGVSTLTGAVGVGNTPIGKFDVYNTGSDTTVFIRSDTTRLGQIVFRDNADAGNQGIVRYDHANDRLSFTANGGENLYLLSTGDLSLITGNVVVSNGKGIDFSATTSGSGTMTSELLADYEEGTFTPTVLGATTAGTATYASRAGYYTKIGRLVTVNIYMDWNSATGTGQMRFGGLPFTSSSSSLSFSPATFGLVNGITLTANHILTGYTETNNTVISANSYPAGGGAYTAVPIDAAGELVITCTYMAA
jgi:hypothetical protein